MVRHYKRKTISKYSEADIQKALEAIRNENLKPCDVACDRNIPLSTLYARLAGKHGHAKRGGHTIFSTEEEEFLVHTVEIFEKWQLPLLRKSLIDIARSYMLELGKKISRTAPLLDWFSGFMTRHPELKVTQSMKLEKVRSVSCNPQAIPLNATTTLLQQAPRISSVPEPINYSSGESTQCDISEQLPIYDQGTSSISMPQLPENQMVHNAMQTLYSEQVENLSNVAYDAVPDQCNWNDNGFTLFENNENLYDPFNSSIELVHQQHTPSRLNQSSTTISDLSANIRTDNSRNSSFEVLTNVISSFLTPSFSSPSKKRKFIIERPHGESLTSMDAIYKIDQKEKRRLKNKKSTSAASKEATKTRKTPAKRGRKPKPLTKPTFVTFDDEDASNDTNANMMPMISCHSNVPYIPPQMPYSTQMPAPYGYNQSLNAFYSYAQSSITCYRCNQEILNGSYTKCTTCIKVCCANCSQLFYGLSTSNFTCEQCFLQSSLDLTATIRN
ncbi:unnamed protein product [Rotaria magnacalcarata]|uniref:HTH CENPB-type domain-containing protein n=1 Tax=Rotaria magnacalcarata TaxID=392030 RepID=A0A816TBL8_9BILA|nr:unnamed protein product [Rotaria magnacalcarata]